MTAPPLRASVPAHVELVHTMGTVVTLDVRAAAGADAPAAAFAAAADRLHETDTVFSTWRADSWASRLLRGEVLRDDCPPEVRDAVVLAERLAETTDGYFSPYWRRGTSTGDGPDPTGLVKGWAAQLASDVLLAHGHRDHVVNAAGDLVLSGSPVPGDTDALWRVGISDPARPGALAGVLELPSGGWRWAVATSGSAERGRHVVDPHTGGFPGAVAAATAVARVGAPQAEAGAWTDACATALVAAGDHAAALVPRLAGHAVRSFVIHADGAVTDPDRLLTPLETG